MGARTVHLVAAGVVSVFTLLPSTAGAGSCSAAVSANPGQVQQVITFSGSGLEANVAYNILFAGGVIIDGVASPTGTFADQFTIQPGMLSGDASTGDTTWALVASGCAPVDHPYTIIAGYPCSAGVSANPGQVQQVITFSGSGLGANVGYDILFAGSAILSGVASSTGTFARQFEIQSGMLPGGASTGDTTWALVVPSGCDPMGGGSQPYTIIAGFPCSAAVSANPGQVQQAITFSGSGLEANVAYHILFAGGFIFSGSASPTGTFAYQFTIQPGMLFGGASTGDTTWALVVNSGCDPMDGGDRPYTIIAAESATTTVTTTATTVTTAATTVTTATTIPPTTEGEGDTTTTLSVDDSTNPGEGGAPTTTVTDTSTTVNAATDDGDGGSSTVVLVLIVAVIGGGVAFVMLKRRGR